MVNQNFIIPSDWFCCPMTKEPLTLKNGVLHSAENTYKQNKKYGYWDFFPHKSDLLKTDVGKTWELLQKNGLVSYESSPSENLGVGKRQDFLDFAEFSDFHGYILDVGVGPQMVPTHIEYCQNKDASFVGIDPLIGDQPRNFPFILGLAEFLPFVNKRFDQVLFVTSLDHFIDIDLAFIEAKRVLKDEGELCIWFGVKKENSPRKGKSHTWYEELDVPDGAIDRFHFIHLDEKTFLDYVDDHNFRIIDSSSLPVDEWRKNCFYKLGK